MRVVFGLLVLSSLLFARVPLLEGKWADACDGHQNLLEFYKKSGLTISRTFYQDRYCSKADFQIRDDFPGYCAYSQANQNFLDLKYERTRVRVLTSNGANTLNDHQLCGFSNWKPGDVRDVSNTDCGWSRKVYTIFDIQNDQLYLGDFADMPGLRPKALFYHYPYFRTRQSRIQSFDAFKTP